MKFSDHLKEFLAAWSMIGHGGDIYREHMEYHAKKMDEIIEFLKVNPTKDA